MARERERGKGRRRRWRLLSFSFSRRRPRIKGAGVWKRERKMMMKKKRTTAWSCSRREEGEEKWLVVVSSVSSSFFFFPPSHYLSLPFISIDTSCFPSFFKFLFPLSTFESGLEKTHSLSTLPLIIEGRDNLFNAQAQSSLLWEKTVWCSPSLFLFFPLSFPRSLRKKEQPAPFRFTSPAIR